MRLGPAKCAGSVTRSTTRPHLLQVIGGLRPPRPPGDKWRSPGDSGGRSLRPPAPDRLPPASAHETEQNPKKPRLPMLWGTRRTRRTVAATPFSATAKVVTSTERSRCLPLPFEIDVDAIVVSVRGEGLRRRPVSAVTDRSPFFDLTGAANRSLHRGDCAPPVFFPPTPSRGGDPRSAFWCLGTG
jgi:hypothetical protein